MKKIYNSPGMRIRNIFCASLLAGSTQIELTEDNASHETEVLSKENSIFGVYEEE